MRGAPPYQTPAGPAPVNRQNGPFGGQKAGTNVHIVIVGLYNWHKTIVIQSLCCSLHSTLTLCQREQGHGV